VSKFRLHSIDSGFCRIYFTTYGDHDQPLYYCAQDEGDRFGGVRFYRCSEDGEPEYEVTPKDWCAVEVPKGDSELELRVKSFIELKQTEGGEHE
jgi:hypothetical protein